VFHDLRWIVMQPAVMPAAAAAILNGALNQLSMPLIFRELYC